MRRAALDRRGSGDRKGWSSYRGGGSSVALKAHMLRLRVEFGPSSRRAPGACVALASCERDVGRAPANRSVLSLDELAGFMASLTAHPLAPARCSSSAREVRSPRRPSQ